MKRQQRWHRQRRKQDVAANSAHDDGVACPECGNEKTAVIGYEQYSCFECETEFSTGET